MKPSERLIYRFNITHCLDFEEMCTKWRVIQHFNEKNFILSVTFLGFPHVELQSINYSDDNVIIIIILRDGLEPSKLFDLYRMEELKHTESGKR
ncbi:CLUMA_CG002161, isoform A [Clunio marinus]|uniref:CLUMA_CG002161, isoform A n=1 Tax=Clunio marinus TaxID=568069 RepID=A0A1J1HK00_9DIPT|nr:CLUMA_CG002161, isoform A [Clunio marinus]